MKHFNLKTLTIGAALVGSLVAGNVYAEEPDASLGLGKVKIVTLQWNGSGRYSGINGGTGWDQGKQGSNPGFGTPSNGNGRIGLVHRDNDAANEYCIACQGKFIKIDENNTRITANSREDATAFTVSGSLADGLNFSYQHSNSTYHLENVQFEIKEGEAPTTSSYKNDTQYNTVAVVEINGNKVIKSGDYYYTIVALPYKVQKPTSDDYQAYIFKKDGSNGIKAEAVVEGIVPAGIPFLYISKTNGDNSKMTIVQDGNEYVETVATSDNNVLDGFYLSLTGTTDPLISDAYIFGEKTTGGSLGFFQGVNFKDVTAANSGFISKTTASQLGATGFEVKYTDTDQSLTVTVISAETGLINDCVELAKKLKDLKEQDGTESGNYDITHSLQLDNTEETYWNDNALDNYDDADDNFYTTNASNKEELTKLKSALENILHKVLETNVHGLNDVEIFTLQWNNAGQYAGLNSGSTWDNPAGFNNPGGGNGRIGLVKKEETTNRYYIACQGQFLKVEDGSRKKAEGRNDATAFIVIRSSDNGLTFVTEDWNYYLTDTNFTPSATAPTTEDYKINTYPTAINIQVVEDKVKEGDDNTGYIYYNSLVYPFKVQTPSGDNYQAFVLSKNGDGSITAEKEETIDAGVPFIYITTSNGDDARMTIPQEGQEYSENVKDNVLKGFYMPLNADSKEHTEAYSLSTKDGKVGYFLGGNFGGDPTAANRGYIDAETAKGLNAESFELVYNAEDGTLKVNIVKPTVSVTIGDAGWATLYSDKALDFSAVEGLTAYTATVDDEQTTVTLTKVDDVPANAGVVLKGEAKEYKIPVATKESTTSQGSLKGSTTEDLQYDANKNYYILAMNNAGNVQFTKLNSGTVAKGKAYLELEKKTDETDSAARVLSVVFEGETTGIVDANREATADGRIYNLNGQSVAQPAKGLYIVNGKKVVIR